MRRVAGHGFPRTRFASPRNVSRTDICFGLLFDCICFVACRVVFASLWILLALVSDLRCAFATIMALKFAFAHVFVAVVASLDSRALEPGFVAKDIARPNIADSSSGEYERMTQAPIVWLNLRKTKLSLPSVPAVSHATNAAVVEHAVSSEWDA